MKDRLAVVRPGEAVVPMELWAVIVEELGLVKPGRRWTLAQIEMDLAYHRSREDFGADFMSPETERRLFKRWENRVPRLAENEADYHLRTAADNAAIGELLAEWKEEHGDG